MEHSIQELIDQYVWLGLYGYYVNKSYAARIIKVSRSTIYRMIADGRLATAFNRVSVRSLWEINRTRRTK